MFLLPFIQDIEVMCEEKRINKDTKDYIYLEKDGEILKFKVSVPHLDITSALESYLIDSGVKNFEILSEKDVKNNFPLNLVRSVGKFRLEGNLLKTKNYLVPPSTSFSDLLNIKYRVNSSLVPFTSRELYIINELRKLYIEDERKFELNIIKNLISKFEVELVEKYNLDLEQIEMCIKNIESLFGNDESSNMLSKLRGILISSENNKRYIKELGLEDKFIEDINKDKQKQKVK